ncbi:MAG: hypothetical protein ACK56I_34025, partial [bacterium]
MVDGQAGDGRQLHQPAHDGRVRRGCAGLGHEAHVERADAVDPIDTVAEHSRHRSGGDARTIDAGGECLDDAGHSP